MARDTDTRGASRRVGWRSFSQCVWLVVGLAVLARPGWTGESAEELSDAIRIGLPAAAFALTLKKRDGQGRRQLYKSFAVNVGATLVLKEAVTKERPDGSDTDAFPSGHASMAFQAAAFMHKRYGMDLAWPAYALASFVAFERVDNDEHDSTDVLAGAALGIASSFVFTTRQGVSASAFAVEDGIGFTISGTF